MKNYTISDFTNYLFSLGIISDEIYESENDFQAYIGLENNPDQTQFTKVRKSLDSICVILHESDFHKMDKTLNQN